MPTTLALQSWGVRGAAVSLVAADATGNTIPNGPGTMLAISNAGAAARTLTLAGIGRCTHGRQHSLVESIPNDSLIHLIPVCFDRRRFSDGVQATYSAVTSLTVAAVTFGTLRGIGTDFETPVALGSAPGTVPIFRTTEEILYEFAAADGMRLNQNDGALMLQIKNEGPAERTLYCHSASNCSEGFRDDEVITLAAGTEEPHPKLLSAARFGRTVSITYDDPTGLSFAAVRVESY
jgi:hypothetical protein